MSKLLTISIAAYNVEKTIEECLDSFLPCRHLKDLEILVINDGSTDHTAEIVSCYEERYPGIIYLINKENGGHGSTLNKSLKLATGDYYRAVDGDDWVDAVEMDRLCCFLKKVDVDVVVDDYREVYPDHSELISMRRNNTVGEVYQFDELFDQSASWSNLFVMSNSTVKTQRLRDVGMKIQENCYYADTDMYFYIGLAARTIVFVDACVYQYRLGNVGQSVSSEGMYKHIEDLIKIESNLIRLYSEVISNIPSMVRRKYLFSIIDSRYTMLFNCYTIVIQKPYKDRFFAEFVWDTKRRYPDIINEMHLSRINWYISMNPTKRVPQIRFLRKTCFFKVLQAIKHLLKPAPEM